MRYLQFLLLLWVTNLGISQPYGIPDPSFLQTGIAAIDYNIMDNDFSASAVQPDGKIVVVGQAGGYPFIGRMLPNGSWDTSFGVNGVWTDTDHPQSGLNDVAIADDGRIYATGYEYVGVNHQYASVVCLLQDGTLDTGFGNPGTPGFVKKDIGLGLDFGKTIHIHTDGMILVGGGAVYTSPTTGITSIDNFIFRLFSYGTEDVSFGIGGVGYVNLNAGGAGGYVNDIDIYDGLIAVCFSSFPYFNYYSDRIRISLLDYADGLEINNAECVYYGGNVSTQQATTQLAFAQDGTLWVAASYIIVSNNFPEMDLYKINTNIQYGTFNLIAYIGGYIHRVTGLIAAANQLYLSGIALNGGKSAVVNFDNTGQLNLSFATNGIYHTDSIYHAEINSLTLSPNGKLICTGASPSIFHANTQSTHDDGFMMVLYTQNTTDISDRYNEISLNLYPNPSNGSFYIEKKGVEPYELLLTDLTGKEYYRQKIMATTESKLFLDTRVPPGIYLLQVTSGNRRYLKKVIVQ